MKFDELDEKLRIYENINDQYVLPGMFIVARLDGRSFTKLTKEIVKFESPFDIKFRNLMVDTVKHLMDCGFRVIYGYTQSDEISLLLHPQEDTFRRKLRKLNSVLAGEASGFFSLSLGTVASFDCRICQLPNDNLVIDYFRWRNEDAHRNALNAHCYWLLRKKGESATNASNYLENKSISDKNELLFQNSINFNDLPSWQKRGIGVYWESYMKEGFNPKKNITEATGRKRLKIDLDLPMQEEYSKFIKEILEEYN